MITKADLERRYLQAILSWPDLRLEHEVLRWQAAGQDPPDRFRRLHIARASALALTRRDAGSQLPPTAEK